MARLGNGRLLLYVLDDGDTRLDSLGKEQMSLSVYLTRHIKTTRNCPSCSHEWEEVTDTEEIYYSNITHNLGEMAQQAGIYKHLWRPEDIGIAIARQLIEPLTYGLAVLESDPIYFRQFDAKNGWGTYANLVFFVTKYLDACKEYPDALVSVCR